MNELGDWLDHQWDHLRHHPTSAAPATAAVTIKPTTPGGPVSLLTEAKTIGHDLLDRLEAIDENAINVIEAIKPNGAAASIANTLASIAHLPDPMGYLPVIDNALKGFAVLLQQGATATAPAGPTVAGQA